MEEKKTKTQKVLEHLQTKGTITSWEAIQLYRATRLSDIIFKLKKKNHTIVTEQCTGADGIRYARYRYIYE